MREIGALQRGFDLPKGQRTKGKFPLVTSSGATDTHNIAKVKGPGVVTGRSGSIGNVFYVEKDFWPLNTALYVKDFNGNCPRFVYYLLQFVDLGRFASGAGVPTLNRNDVHGELIAIPNSVEEQQRIVAILDEAFEGLTLARAHAEANLQNARELFTAKVDALLSTGGEDWHVGSLSKLVGPVATGPFGSLLHKSDYVENETPLVNPANIVNGKIVPDQRKTVDRSALERLSSYILEAGDIVIGRRGEMGRCAVVEEEQAGWLCGTGSFFIRPKGAVVPKFVAHVLRSLSYVALLEAASTGATMANLSNRVLSDLKLALPEEQLQTSFLELIEDMEQVASNLEFSYSAKCKDLDDLRQSLLQKAFAGELT
ncbi:MAG: restriction endonuclease subunit S [Rhodobacteraceae bacterium]|nr:restriction endonuclease subunit S [Paracoccaceae bacterium]